MEITDAPSIQNLAAVLGFLTATVVGIRKLVKPGRLKISILIGSSLILSTISLLCVFAELILNDIYLQSLAQIALFGIWTLIWPLWSFWLVPIFCHPASSKFHKMLISSVFSGFSVVTAGLAIVTMSIYLRLP